MSEYWVALGIIGGGVGILTGWAVWMTVRAMGDDGYGAHRDRDND